MEEALEPSPKQTFQQRARTLTNRIHHLHEQCPLCQFVRPGYLASRVLFVYRDRSLLSLGNVITALSEGRHGHIPYRDSTLTRLLQVRPGSRFSLLDRRRNTAKERSYSYLCVAFYCFLLPLFSFYMNFPVLLIQVFCGILTKQDINVPFRAGISGGQRTDPNACCDISRGLQLR